MKKKIVKPHYFEGMNVSWNLNLFCGPKFTITCGDCLHTFTKRLPLVDKPKIECPHCKVLNEIPVTID